MFKSGIILSFTICFASGLILSDEFSHLSSQFLSDQLDSFQGLRKDVPMTVEDAKIKSRADVEKYRSSTGTPGIVAGISVNGNNVWMEAFGKSDVENNVPTHVDSVWRLASISKPVTSALVGKLIDQGKLDLDKSIYEYLGPEIFPRKKWKSLLVDITLKQVMAHTAGLRQSDFPEDVNHIVRRTNVTETIAQFKDAPLISEPGTVFAYSNYGWQIVGAVIESVMKIPYEQAINHLLKSELNMTSTFAERLEYIIPRRARYYMQKASGTVSVINADIIDQLICLEGWWPAGGLVSTVPDQLKFGNNMLKSYHGNNGFLKQSTVKKLWTPNKQPMNGSPEFHYGEGWGISNLTQPIKCDHNDCKTPPIKTIIFHNGGITGVSTYLMIFPEQNFVVSVLSNLGSATKDLYLLTVGIARNFML